MERELSALRVALSTLSYMNCLLLSNEIWGNLSMKKAIRSVFILQLIVFSIVGTAIYFQNQYVSLFYKDVSYIDVLVSDEEAFDSFLSWTEERGIVVSRVAINPDNEVTLHMSDWALCGLNLLEGNVPSQGEFVSDIITDDTNQSGIMRRILPNFNFKVYGLYKPEQVNFTGLYAISTTSENEIAEMKEELELEGVTILPNEIYSGDSTPLLLSSFSRMHVIIVLIFVCVSTMVIFVALLQYFVQQAKSVNIYITLGYSRLRTIYCIISDLFFGKSWIGIVGGLGIILSIVVLCMNKYRPFYVQIVVVYLVLSLLTSYIYTIFFGCVLLIYLLRRKQLSVALKGMKPNKIVQITNYCVKLASVILLFVAFSYFVTLHGQYTTEKYNMQSWIDAKDMYKISMSDVGQDYDLSIEVELHKKVSELYQYLTTENNAFFMDADDVYAMEIYGVDYPLTGLVTNGFSTHITVSPNYFTVNPIFTSDGIPVEQEIIYSDNILNILVPESLSSIYEKIKVQFLDYFDFYRFRIYENIYSDAPNDLWDPSRENELEVNIIPVKTGQSYFTLSPDIRQADGNKILDPVVVVYTDNFHPSSIFTKASRCLYFQYDGKQGMTPNEYIADVTGMDGFVYAKSVWKDVEDRVSKLESNYFITFILAVFIIECYLMTSYCLVANYFVRNSYIVTIKTLWGYSVYKRYSSAFVMLLSPALLALLFFVLIAKTRLAHLFPDLSLQGIILIGAVIIGIDILYFAFMEKILNKKSLNRILKGEAL